MGGLFKGLTGFSADLLGVTLLMSSNGESGSLKQSTIAGTLNNKVYRMTPPTVKSNVRVVAETIFDNALDLFQNVVSQARHDQHIQEQHNKGPLEQLDDIFASNYRKPMQKRKFYIPEQYQPKQVGIFNFNFLTEDFML